MGLFFLFLIKDGYMIKFWLGIEIVVKFRGLYLFMVIGLCCWFRIFKLKIFYILFDELFNFFISRDILVN